MSLFKLSIALLTVASGLGASSAYAACWFRCVPSNAESERLAKAHLGSPMPGVATIAREIRLAQRSNVQLAVDQRKKLEPALLGRGRCDAFTSGCNELLNLASHRLIEAVEWLPCPSASDWYCAIPIFSKTVSEAIAANMVRTEPGAITVKTADVRFGKILRTRGDGDQAEIHYEIEIVPNIFGRTIAPIQAARQERAFVAIRYSDGWRYVR